jgi:hypothetical protein
MLRLMHAGCVNEDDLGLGEGEDAKLAAARGLRARGNGSNFLAEQGV